MGATRGGTPRPLPPVPSSLRSRFTFEPADLDRVAHDASPAPGRPAARFTPRGESDVAALVRWARKGRVPVVARGAGTSLDGESAPVRGGVVVDFSGMSRVLEINEEDLWARVQPGVVNYRLQEALRPHGLFYPPNPGSWERSTIGGNAATNASGFRSFRYGPTRAWVVQARAVLGTGETVTAGTLTWKRSAGADLLPSLLGSEGTLALFTELTLRLVPLPARRVGLLAPVPPGASLGKIARGLQWAKREGLSAVEWVDARVAGVLARDVALPLEPGSGALLLEVETPREVVEDVASRWQGGLRPLGIEGPVRPFEDAEALWRARGQAGTLLDRELGPRVREDVAVPLSQWDRLTERVQRLAKEQGVGLVMYAHLGEGSLHPNFLIEPGSARAAVLRRALWTIAWSLGGTASAEHGLGSLKAAAFVREHGAPSVRALRALKDALDPDGIFNPGKFWG